ncbi:unnamed protein product [Coregonus sp. 'balchen']|nr:unnamed protein product [Coregonus sp. 'balchen']
MLLAELPVPQNVILRTLNTQYLLIWDWDQTTTGNTVTFTAEYMARVCERTTDTHCNFTGSDLHYFGMYVLRVRASADGLNSDWVLKDFCPDKDAVLGPPSRVELAPVGNLLDVTISDPLTSTQGSMKEHVLSLYYHILYWSHSDDPQGLKPKVVDSSNNLVTLPELEAWTWYCVMVQSRYDYYNKTSSYTAPQCMQTEGDTLCWQIFLVSLVACILLVLLPYAFFRFYRFLCDSSTSSEMPILLTPESELCYNNLSVCPEVVLLEIHIPPPFTAPPSGLEQDSSRHSRQGSEGSGDSGVYSTEGGSAQQGRSGRGVPIRRDKEVDSWQTLEQDKLEMGGEPGD